ncbi:hypothetical protein D5018_14085 [Parashewanella curva]|uniref:DUF2178 domain-containing protein n=1 Tax=Parashewanella curva TaxID=2338552 RepID=A0A3L8PUH6_9GAMM|nr:hypothetical protein [Parashewanella curva]RLV59075.1 hypothetical protein D5018_14085 [Parashewanella curva]
MKKILNAIACGSLPKRDIRNANIVNLWGVAWVLSLWLALTSIDNQWLTSTFEIIAVLTINAVIGIAMVFAYKRMLNELDEMERKIQLDALAAAVGSIIIVFAAGSILEKATLINELEVSHVILAMSLTYAVSLIIGRVRYA